MQKESWLVKKNRVTAMRFFQDKFPDENGTTYMRVHFASCKGRFLYGISPHVQLHASEKMTIETALIVVSFISSTIALVSEILPFVKKTRCNGIADAISKRTKNNCDNSKKK